MTVLWSEQMPIFWHHCWSLSKSTRSCSHGRAKRCSSQLLIA